jgi:hypothetical protein
MFTAASAVGFFVFTTNNDHPLAALTCDDTPTGPIYCCSTRAAGQVDTVVCPGSRRARTAPAPITGIRRIEASITEAVATGSLPAATGADELLKAFDPTAQNPDHG